jgi:hypothetical protein
MFTEVTASSGMSTQSILMDGWSPNIGDFDNDGWKDLFVSRGDVGSVSVPGRLVIEQNNTVFRNLEGKKWKALTEEAGFTAVPPRRHRGAAIGDFNRDGKLDIVVSALNAPAEIWMNDSPGTSHWIEFKLEGSKSNRDGIGAKVKIVSGGRPQWDHVSHAAGYASSSATPLHFGLGAEKSVEEVDIQWPSGIRQTLKNLSADQIVRIREADAKP